MQNDGKTTPEPHLNRIWSALEMALQIVPCMAPIMAPWAASLADAKWRLNDICSSIPNPPLALDLLFVFIKKKKVLVKMENATKHWYQLLNFYILH